MHYFPIALPFFLFLGFLFLIVLVLIEIGILSYAYERIGIDRRYLFAVLLLSWLGGYINIPVAQLSAKYVHSGEIVSYFGMQYMIPIVKEWPGTVIAVNLGGAVIPTLLSIYLVVKNNLYVQGALAVAIVAAAIHMMAHPVPGVGIAEPIFIPPVITAAVALLLSRRYAPPLAYIGGSLGTLIGADLLNLGKIQGLGAPVASIGGAGTFDGIFLTGILSVLLASLMSPKWR